MRIFSDIYACNDDGVPTASSQEQVREFVWRLYGNQFLKINVECTCRVHATTARNGEKVQLNVRQHVARLRESLQQVAEGYQVLFVFLLVRRPLLCADAGCKPPVAYLLDVALAGRIGRIVRR